MLSKLRSYRPSHAVVVAYLALFVALGGSSYAAITITGKNVKDSSLTGKDVKNRSLTGKDIKKSSLTTTEVKDRSLLAKDFKSGQLLRGVKGDKGDPGSPGGPVGVTVRVGLPLTPGTNATGPGCVDGVPGGSKGYHDGSDTLVSCGAGAGGSAFNTVPCGSGEVAVGGGYTFATGKRHALVSESVPSPSAVGSTPTGWHIKVETLTFDSSNTTPVTPYAICMKR